MKPATLRKELAILKRMLRLASADLPRIPMVNMPRVDNARQGFFEEEEVQALLPHLPPHAEYARMRFSVISSAFSPPKNSANRLTCRLGRVRLRLNL